MNNKKNILVLFLVLFQINLYAISNNQRMDLSIEYRLVNACINCQTSKGVTPELRDWCINRVLEIEKKFTLEEVEDLDNSCELEELFILE